MIYENGSLKEILLPEGYWQSGTYYYYLKDHLGDNRVTINSSGTVIEKSHYYPSGMRFYPESSSNSSALPYRYNGKELETMNGLNQYDYGARRREAGLPMWTAVDPLAEKYYSISPYAYCGGNPINKLDPDGQDEYEINKKGEVVNIVTNTNHDSFHIVDDENKRQEGDNYNISFGYGTISYQSRNGADIDEQTKQVTGTYCYDVYTVNGDGNSEKLYNFMTDSKSGTNVEWDKFTTGKEGDSGVGFLTTSHNPSTDKGAVDYLNNEIVPNQLSLRDDTHNHPGGTHLPSSSDIEFARSVSKYYPQATFHIKYSNNLPYKSFNSRSDYVSKTFGLMSNDGGPIIP
jgi:RHS repeat-associated protein